jgi:hypothetical protein
MSYRIEQNDNDKFFILYDMMGIKREKSGLIYFGGRGRL